MKNIVFYWKINYVSYIYIHEFLFSQMNNILNNVRSIFYLIFCHIFY